MALELGGLLGAVTQATTAASGEKDLKSFLQTANKLGIQVNNNFEVNFSGIPEVTFYLQSISIPGITLATTDLYYAGQKVEIPVNYDWNHDFSVTMINDAQGYFYSAIANFFMSQATSQLVNSGFTMTVKALTGDKSYKGTMYTLYGVRLVGLGSIEYSYSGADVSTFNIDCKCTHFTVTPGALGTVANVLGAVNSLIS